MKRLSALLLTLIVAGCASADSRDVPEGRDLSSSRHGGQYAGEGRRPARSEDAATFIPPFNWWHNDAIANAISLTADQVRALDAALGGDSADFARMETDARNAMRDLRIALEADDASADRITAAAQRVRETRNALFDRQVQMLVAERKIVTTQQWKDLDEMLQRSGRGREDNRGRRDNRGGYPGGFPGSGPTNPWGW